MDDSRLPSAFLVGSREGVNVIAHEWYWVYVGCRAPCLRNEPAAHRPLISRPRAPNGPGRCPVSCAAFLNERNYCRRSGWISVRRPSRGAGRTRKRRPSSGRGVCGIALPRVRPKAVVGLLDSERLYRVGASCSKSRPKHGVYPPSHHGRLLDSLRPGVAGSSRAACRACRHR